MGNAMAAAGNVTSLCGACSGQGEPIFAPSSATLVLCYLLARNHVCVPLSLPLCESGHPADVSCVCGGSPAENYDRNTIDATMAQHNLQRAKWHETPAAHTASNSPPNLAMPRGPAIMMQPDARQAKGIMKSPRPMLSDDDRQRVKMLLENDEEMDTEAYQAVLDNMTIDDTTHHFGPLTEDADVYGMRTEDDLTIMDDFSESLALKSARSNKNVSMRPRTWPAAAHTHLRTGVRGR